MTTEIRRAYPGDAVRLAEVMRPEDAAELKASGYETPVDGIQISLNLSKVAYTILFDGEVAAMFGAVPLWPPATTLSDAQEGVAWALTGQTVTRHKRDFLRACRPALAMLLTVFPRLENFVDARYASAIRWAKWLGFEVRPAVQRGGFLFHPISIRRS